jgi:prepilin peptidase CpaA
MTAQIWIALAVGTAAVIEDVARRQISNWIPCAAFFSGLLLQILLHGWRGLGSSLLGALAGFGVFLLFYLLGGMGGGDVKLMAGFGALLGPGKVLEAALWTAGCGGVFAVLFLAARWIHGRWLQGMFFNGKKTEGAADRKQPDSIPYAPAIAAGVWLSLVPKG